MQDVLLSVFSGFPKELAVFLLSMTPIGELRLSLPVGVLVYHMPIWEVYVISVIGNFIPSFIILLFADKFHKWVEKKSGFFASGWLKALARAQEKFHGDYMKYGLIGLMIFIGVPLPGTGAYTGALAAFVLGISFKKSWPYVLFGIMISGILTSLVTFGADKIF
jgi:uncharacterized membrane protein